MFASNPLVLIRRHRVRSHADTYFAQTVFAISRVRLVLCAEFPLTPDQQSSFTLIWIASKQRPPGLAAQEILPLLNKSQSSLADIRMQNLSLRSPSKFISGFARSRAEYDELQVRLLELDGARKEAVNARRKAEGEKKEVQATAVQRELELTQKVSEMQNKYIDLLEQLNQQKALNDGLRDELHRLTGSFYQEHPDYQRQTRTSLDSSRTSEERFERSELKGLDVPEQEFMISPLPEFTSNALAADNFVSLPGDDDSEGDSPRSYDRLPVSQNTPEEVSSNPPTAPVTPSLKFKSSFVTPSFNAHSLTRKFCWLIVSCPNPHPFSPADHFNYNWRLDTL
ncbi:hypothetical protein LENED_011189 [Lentinula edodes]|uniref:Uncharacterized protein n=1 Tax=Lentinula edodes TaxID=5353 RepID=A0A1Q3EPC5_LENED|nr:hypothetical protein LENED_011189 [Lentinula edodes]